MSAAFSLAYRSFISNPLRSAVLIVAVLLGVAGFTAVRLTNEAIGRGVERSWYATVGTSHLQVRSFGPGFSDRAVAEIGRLPGVAAVAPTARKWVFSRTATGRGFVELIAVDPGTETMVRPYGLASGRFVAADRPRGVVLRADWAAERGLRLDDSIELITRDGLRTFEVMGLLAPDQAGVASYGSAVLVSIQAARQSFGMEDRVGAISITLSGEEVLPGVQEAIRGLLSGLYAIQTSPQVRAELEQSVAELQGSLALFGAVALFVAIFLILNTVEMTASGQVQQVGRLRAVGATRTQIFAYFVAGALIPGALGSLAGAILGFVLARGLALWVQQLQSVAVIAVTPSGSITAEGFLAGLVAVVVASIAPAVRVARSNPLDMLQQTQAEGSTRATLIAAAVGVLLAGLSLIALLAGDQRGAGRDLRAIALLPLLIGLVLASRAVIGALSHLLRLPFRVIGGAPGRLAARNLTRHANRTGLTVGGFGVSLSLLVALTAVAAGSARSGERWARSLMPGDYAVVSPVDQPPELVGRFANLEGVAKASPVSFIQTLSAGQPIQLASVEPDVYAPRLDYVEGSPAQAVADMARGGSVILPRRLAVQRGLRVNDQLPIEGARGSASLRVAAVVANAFPSAGGAGSALISRVDGQRLFDNDSFRIISLATRAGEARLVMRERVAELAERYGMSATTPEEVTAHVNRALFQLLALFAALVGIGVVVAALGTANTMLMNIAERARELSVLWAAGMSRDGLQTMAVIEAALMGLMGGLLGAGVGAILSAVLVALWTTSGFQPEYVFPAGAAAVGIGAAVFASVAATLIPARAAGRLDIAV
jgi:putative ABC transport system permease protein